MAFATGKFDIITQSRNGYEMTMFHRETDSSKVARNADAIFDLHGDALEWMENYTGIKYTFQKFDFLANITNHLLRYQIFLTSNYS